MLREPEILRPPVTEGPLDPRLAPGAAVHPTNAVMVRSRPSRREHRGDPETVPHLLIIKRVRRHFAKFFSIPGCAAVHFRRISLVSKRSRFRSSLSCKYGSTP